MNQIFLVEFFHALGDVNFRWFSIFFQIEVVPDTSQHKEREQRKKADLHKRHDISLFGTTVTRLAQLDERSTFNRVINPKIFMWTHRLKWYSDTFFAQVPFVYLKYVYTSFIPWFCSTVVFYTKTIAYNTLAWIWNCTTPLRCLHRFLYWKIQIGFWGGDSLSSKEERN